MDISQQLQRAFLEFVVCNISDDSKSLSYEDDSEPGFVSGFTVCCGDDYDDEGRIHAVVDVYIRDRVKFEDIGGPSYKFTCAFNPKKKNIRGFVRHVITKLDDQVDLWGRGL